MIGIRARVALKSAVVAALAIGAFGLGTAGADVAPSGLPADSARVGWAVEGLPVSWAPGEIRTVLVTITNQSAVTWPDRAHAHPLGTGRNAVRLSYCWSGTTDCLRARADLASSLAPGASATLEIRIRAPEEPGRYTLEFDLVEELVAWFRNRGGQVLTREAVVRPRVDSIGMHAARVAGLVLAAMALLFYCGFGLTRLLPGGRTSAATPMLTPIVGLCALSLVGHALARLPAGTSAALPGILIGFGAVDLIAWMRGARVRPTLRNAGAWAACVLALVLAALPLVRVGLLTTLGGEVDGIVYATRAEWMKDHGLLVLPEYSLTSYFDLIAYNAVVTGLRQGDQYVLAVLSSLFGYRPHQLFSVLMAVFYGLVPIGVFVYARNGVRASKAAATLAAVLVAVQPLLHYVALNSFLSQAAGIAVFPCAAYALSRVFRARGLRAIPLAALLLAGLSTFYSAYVFFLAPAVAVPAVLRLVGGRRTLRRRLGVCAARVVLLAVLSWAIAPVGWWLTYRGIVLIRQISASADLSKEGNISLFPPPGEAIGLVSHAPIAHAFDAPQLPSALSGTLTVLACAVILVGLATTRGAGRWLGAGMVATLVASALQQRFLVGGGQGFAYGYFKVVALATPFLLVFLAQGVVWLVRRARTGGPVWLGAAGAAALLTAVVGATSLFHLRRATHYLAVRRLVVDRDALELDVARSLIPPGESLLVEDGYWPGRSWDLYLLRHPRHFDRSAPAAQPVQPEAASDRLIRYALIVAILP
jgi:hypothetical protein